MKWPKGFEPKKRPVIEELREMVTFGD